MAACSIYRSVVRADHTLDEVVEDEGYYIDAFDGASYEGHAGEIIAPRNDSSLLARNVVDFGIAFYTLDGSGRNRAVYPSSSGQKDFRVPREMAYLPPQRFLFAFLRKKAPKG